MAAGEGKKAKDDKKQDNLVNEALIGCLGKFDNSGEQREKAKKLFDEIHEKTEEGSSQRLNCNAARLQLFWISKSCPFQQGQIGYRRREKSAEESTEAFALAEKAAAYHRYQRLPPCWPLSTTQRPDAAELKKDYEKKRDLYFENHQWLFTPTKRWTKTILELMKFVTSQRPRSSKPLPSTPKIRPFGRLKYA